MNAEMLIKARKVFVEDNIVENSEDCPHCKSKGLQKKLRYFYLSLEEMIYKCENATCLYPFERFMFKSLIDNSVYYYEEVVDDGGRELFFRVPMDRQNDFQSSNPLSTKLFCDNQRNPMIEDYSCDFSDLFNDIDTDIVETPQVKQPASSDNPDALEFLDEINNINTSHGQNQNERAFDSIIDEILNESSAKCSPKKMTTMATVMLPPPPATPQPQPQPSVLNVNVGTTKAQPKLLKCIQHLDKAKKVQSRKTSEKSKQPFATAMLKARKSQTKVQDESASTSEQSECQKRSVKTSKQKPNQITRPSSMSGFLKTANNLRPVELARQLSTLKSINTNSEFLRQYMKAKEEKLFAEDLAQDEAKQVESVTVEKSVATNQNILSNPNTKPMIDSMQQPISNAAPNKTNTTKKPSSRKSVKNEESTQKDGDVKKKERKPRAKKQNTVENAAVDIGIKKEQHNVGTESAIGATVTGAKKVVSAKRKPVKQNNSTESCSTSTETMNQDKAAVIKAEPKKNPRKRKPASVDGDDTKAMEKGSNESVGPAKRQRKSKCDSKGKNGKNDEVKPKRTRTTKPKVNLIKLEQPSLPLLVPDGQVIYTNEIPVHGLESNSQPETLSSILENEPSRPNECNLKASVANETFEIPSTSENNSMMITIGEHGVGNVLVAADPVHTNESNLIVGLIQNQSIYSSTENTFVDVCDNTDGSIVCFNPIENIVSKKRQRKSKCENVENPEQIKPKRGRTPKSKVNPNTKIEQPSFPQPMNDDVTALISDPQNSVCGTNLVSPLSTQQNVSVQKSKRKPKKNVVESTEKEEMNEIPSTSKEVPTIVTNIEVHNTFNDLVAAADSVHTNQLDSSHSTKTEQHTLADTAGPSKNATDKGKRENVSPAKRQCRSKCSNIVKVVPNESKPKRGRASKSKVKIEQPSLPLLLNDNVTDSHTEGSTTDERTPIVGDELNSCHTIEIMQHQSSDTDNSNKCIDVNESVSESIISIGPNEDIDTETKKNVRKRKTTSVDASEPKLIDKKSDEKVGTTKRQRKSKCDSGSKADQTKIVEIKPKRSRATKPKANPIHKELASSLPLNDNDVTDSQGKLNETETNSCSEQMNMEKVDFGVSKRQKKCALESKVNEKTYEKPSTSQMNPMMDTIFDHSAANDLIAILDELNPGDTTETVEQEVSSAKNSNINTKSNENQDEQQSNFTHGQLIQHKIEPMDSHATAGSDNGPNRKKKPNEASDTYYRRKVFKQVKEESFCLDDLLDEWDENVHEQQKNQTQKDTPISVDLYDNDDAISIASGTSDSSFAFVGEPYYDGTKHSSDQNQPTTSSNQ